MLILKKLLKLLEILTLSIFSRWRGAAAVHPTSSTKSRFVLLAPTSRAPGNYQVPVKCGPRCRVRNNLRVETLNSNRQRKGDFHLNENNRMRPSMTAEVIR